MIFKTCSKCKTEKPTTDFYREANNADNLLYHCKSCVSSHRRASYGSDTSPARARLHAAQETPRGRASELHANARARASAKGLEFALTTEWVAERVRAGMCEATGIQFILKKSGGRGSKPFSPSLDRIDNNLGYTMDNCHIVCWMYNAAKGTATTADVLLMARALVAANA